MKKMKTWTTVPASTLQARIEAFIEENRLGGPEMFHTDGSALVLRLYAEKETGRQGPLADLYYGARPSERDAFERIVSRAGYRASYGRDAIVFSAA